ncbi:MAG: quinone-dependent dihydroorotate dehydrogenase [Bacteroidia bacterium]|nr:quinone-dependent dihydroorotate dehydrogenase [Bacteroidia bacterium]
MWKLWRSVLFSLPAESAHRLVLWGAKVLSRLGVWGGQCLEIAPVELWGLRFSHPVGLAAGLDKNAEALGLWAHLGLAFVEVGTVTPRPQPGNPLPRLFRIPKDLALLNRLGFNNDGAIAVARRLEKRPSQLIIGINIGKNRDTPLEEAYKDYADAFRILRDLGDFFVINVSSPNTPNLRKLQAREALIPIVEALQNQNPYGKPLLLKISPDLTDEEIDALGEMAQAIGIAGWVAGNTTTQVEYPHLGPGGVSGAPLRPFRRRLVQRLRPFGIPIIGVGGILSARDMHECLEDGASLVELYTGLVYKGPPLIRELLNSLRTP